MSSSQTPEPPALVDMRLLAFGPKAVAAALESVGVRLLNVPVGRAVTGLVFDTVGKTIGATFADESTHVLDQSRIAALMIAYCIGAKLPIARNANKSVDVKENGVTLKFTMTMATAPRIKA